MDTTTILFLHGWGGDEDSFSSILPYFKKFYTCLTPSPRIPHPWTLEDYTESIEKLLDESGVTSCHIIAHSFGARIAALLVTRNANRYGNLVLTGAAGLRRRKSFYKRLRVFLHKRRILKNKGSYDYRNLSDTEKITFKNVVNRDLASEFAQIKNPTLLVFGRNDKQTPQSMGKRMNKLIENSKLVIYKSSAHFPFIDNPDRFIVDTVNSLS